jgi:hypothetical protein
MSIIRVPRIVTAILPQLQDTMQQLEEHGEDSISVLSSILDDIQDRFAN